MWLLMLSKKYQVDADRLIAVEKAQRILDIIKFSILSKLEVSKFFILRYIKEKRSFVIQSR